MIPEEINKQIEDRAKSYYKNLDGNSLKPIHEVGFLRGAEFGYELALQQIADKEKERLYWKQRCEAAENILSCVPLPDNVGFRNLYLPGFVEAVEKYQQLKNQSTKEEI